MDRQYAAFISYRHAELDSAVAKTLHTLIEQYRIPKDLRKNGQKRIGVVFRDEEELQTSSDLNAQILTALNNSRFLVVICSENTVESAWVSKEIEAFLKTHDRSRVLTVLASGKWEDVVPRQLTDIVREDGSIQRVDPFSMEVCAHSTFNVLKNLRRKLPELLSTMLGCHKDVLIHREQKRKTRRIASVSAAIIAVLLVFLSMLTAKNRQIEQRNEELARQKAEVQLRESQLLTQDAREALDNGDYRTAITQAVAALPKPGEENRPYHAPAEGILMESLSLFTSGDPPVILNTTELTQKTEINQFCINEDGGLVFTIDDYGLIHCFRTRDGQIFWSRTATPVPGATSTSDGSLCFCGDRLVSRYGGQLEARNPRTGDLLWSRELPDCLAGYLFYHREQDILVLMEVGRNEDYIAEGHLLVLSAETGETLQRLALTCPDGTFPSTDSYTAKSFSPAGSFSEDGTAFAGAYVDSYYNLHCFTADLTAGTAEIFYTHEVPTTYRARITALDLREDEHKLLLTAHSLPDTDVASALMLDTASGKLLWQTDIPGNPHSYSFAYDESFPHIASKLMLLGFYNQIYHLELENGSIVSQENAGGILTMLEGVNDYSFAYSLDNGTCGLGWLYDDGTMALSGGADYQVYASLPPHRMLKIWGGGIVQMKAGGGILLSVSNIVEPGYAAVIPEDSPNVLRIVRPVQLQPVVERHALELPDVQFSAANGCIGSLVGDRLILGPMYRKYPDTYETDTMYLILDPETHQILDTWTTDQNLGGQELVWLPDGSGILRNDHLGSLFFIGEDGDEQELTDPEESLVSHNGQWYFVSNLIRSDSAYQAADSSPLSARVNTDTLTLWQGNSQTASVPLPPQLCCAPDKSFGMTRFLKVSETGLVFVTLHAERAASSDFAAVYDTQSEAWLTLPGSWTIPGEANVAFSAASPLMAVLDSTDTLQILDLSAPEIRITFPGLVPSGSVAHMEFLLDDSCLALKTQDGAFLIFDLADGSVLYEDQVSSYGSGFHVYEDAANRRLYLSSGLHNSDPDGICIDLRSWTRLSYLDGLLYFDGERGILYQHNAVGFDTHCVYSRIPGTAELVELGMTMIE